MFGVVLFPVSSANGAAGTAASFAAGTVTQANENSWVTLRFTGLTADSEFIVVEATLGNFTMSTGTGQTTGELTIKVDTSGSLVFNVYGYDVATGASSGSILDSWLLSVTPASDYNADQITDQIPFFIGLLIGSILLGMAVKKAF